MQVSDLTRVNLLAKQEDNSRKDKKRGENREKTGKEIRKIRKRNNKEENNEERHIVPPCNLENY